MQKKALIAMSGGVDSSVAAYLAMHDGLSCIGATMQLHPSNDGESQINDARSVAQRLDIPFYTLDLREEFRCEVMDHFVQSYEDGLTPNPCVICNQKLKFGHLLDAAIELGCDYVVTGHYAKTRYDEATGRYLLWKAEDPAKDQSYVLYSLTQEQLAHVQFPLGELTKPQVRAIAEEHGFVTAHKSDSQDICFIKDGMTYADFIEMRTGRKFKPGNFVDTTGKVLGRHKGIIHYTVGQRKGLGLALPEPMYVKEIDVAHNQVILSTNAQLFSKSVTATDINLIDCERITEPRRVKARIRYHHIEQWATVTQPDDNTLQLEFDEPQRAITKGQALVLYDGDVVVGGGRII